MRTRYSLMWRDGKLTMRYKCWGPDPAKSCYAESRDGIHWERPNLGLVEYDSSTDNNISVGGTGSVIKVCNPRHPKDQ